MEKELWVIVGAAAIGGALLIIQLYGVLKVILNRHALHVANRNLGLLLIVQLSFVFFSLSFILKYAEIGMGRAHWSPTARALTCLGFGHAAVAFPIDMLFKLKLLVLKFKESSNPENMPVPSKLGILKLEGLLNVDIRTTKGRSLCVLVAELVSIAVSTVLLTQAESMCFHACRVPFPSFNSHILLMIPVAIGVFSMGGGIVWELRKIGPIDEGLGILQEFKGLMNMTAPGSHVATTVVLLLEFKVIEPHWAFLADLALVTCVLTQLWFGCLCLLNPNGYGLELSCLPAAIKVSPTVPIESLPKPAVGDVGGGKVQAVSVEEYKELTVMLALLLPPPPCTPSTLPSLSPERQSSGSRRDSGSCLPQDEAIRQVARRLLSEEAVVCAVSMYRLRFLPRHKAGRQSMLKEWQRIVSVHLTTGSALPVCIAEGSRQRLCHLVHKAERRLTLCVDDCDAVNVAFEEVLRELSPAVFPVLKAYIKERSAQFQTGEPAVAGETETVDRASVV